MENLSQFVVRIMKQKGLSQADIVQRCGRKIAQGYISDIISGKVTNLSMDKFKALAEGLDVDVMELFAAACGVQEQKANRSDWLGILDIIEKVVSDPRLMEIFQTSVRLLPDEREIILTTMQNFVWMRDRQKQSKKRG